MPRTIIDAKLCVAVLLCACSASARAATSPVSFDSFDVPGSIGYSVAGINDEGTIAGTWTADGVTFDGFIRSPRGLITAPVIEPNDNEGFTVVRAINDEGVVAGFYGAAIGHGFLLIAGS